MIRTASFALAISLAGSTAFADTVSDLRDVIAELERIVSEIDDAPAPVDPAVSIKSGTHGADWNVAPDWDGQPFEFNVTRRPTDTIKSFFWDHQNQRNVREGAMTTLDPAGLEAGVYQAKVVLYDQEGNRLVGSEGGWFRIPVVDGPPDDTLAPGSSIQAAYDAGQTHIVLTPGAVYEGALRLSDRRPLRLESPRGQPRAVIRVRDASAIEAVSGVPSLHLSNLDIRIVDRDARDHHTGVRVLQWSDAVVIENCRIAGFKDNVTVQGRERDAVKKFELRESEILHAYGHWDSGHSSGVFLNNVAAGWIIEDSLFDRNGWNPNVSGGIRTKFNHNIYAQGHCGPGVVRRNKIYRGASYGLQMRPGGVVEENIFWRNALAVFVTNTASEVRGNLVIESDDQGNGPDDKRGFGIEVFGVPTALVEDNIVIRKLGTNGAGIAFKVIEGVIPIQRLYEGPIRATFRNNAVHDFFDGQGDHLKVYDNREGTFKRRVTLIEEGTRVSGFVDPDVAFDRDLPLAQTLAAFRQGFSGR